MARAFNREKTTASLQHYWKHLRALLTNKFFWGGLAGLLVVLSLLYMLFNHVIMPAYTRHDVSIAVPDVRNYTYEDAVAVLMAQDLEVEQQVQRFNPQLPRDVVVEQNPAPNAPVKPGRRIYLTVNSGTVKEVQVPRVAGLSLREAQNRMITAGLRVNQSRPDSIPSPHPNTVTRQQPNPGTMVPLGSSVTLWFSTGLGNRYVSVPEVTGLTVAEARRMLIGQRLRSVVLGSDRDNADQIIEKQSPAPGTQVREGFEVRLFTEE